MIPAFNAERTIAATLRSVLAQTHSRLDIIVVDDGSTDRSMVIVADLQAGDSRIRCVHQANAGPAAARNAGAALAKAPFVAFCDADDLWAPRKIERQLDRLQAGGPDMALVYCWFARIDEKDHVLAIDRSGGEGALLPTLLRRNVIGNGSSPLFRTCAFDALGGFSGKFCPAEDLAIYLAAAERYEIGVVHEVLVGYRMSRNSLSSNGIAVCTATSRIMQTYAPRYPGFRGIMTLHLRGVIMWQVTTAVRRGRLIAAIRLLLMDFGIFGTIFTSYLPELLLGLRHRKIKASWITLLSRGRGEKFDAISG